MVLKLHGERQLGKKCLQRFLRRSIIIYWETGTCFRDLKCQLCPDKASEQWTSHGWLLRQQTKLSDCGQEQQNGNRPEFFLPRWEWVVFLRPIDDRFWSWTEVHYIVIFCTGLMFSVNIFFMDILTKPKEWSKLLSKNKCYKEIIFYKHPVLNIQI